jgi:hypothetical protein
VKNELVVSAVEDRPPGRSGVLSRLDSGVAACCRLVSQPSTSVSTSTFFHHSSRRSTDASR